MKVKKKGLNIFDKIFLLINGVLSLFLLFSYLAAHIDPAKNWLFAFFGLAFPFLLFANLFMVAYWLLRRSWLVLLPIICILIGWNVVLNNVGIRLPSNKSYKPSLTVLSLMTFNVHNFKPYGYKNDINTKHEFLKLIAEQQPGIIGMQEFFTKKRGQYDMIDSLKSIMQSDHYYYEAFDVAESESAGMAIFSKFPIIAHGMVMLEERKGGNQCLYVDVKDGHTIFRMYNVHLQSIGFEPPDYEYLEAFAKKGKANVIGTKRVFMKLRSAFIKRSQQVKIIKDHAAQCPYPYIISGDFNDTPASYAVTQMSKGLKNAFREKGAGMCRTYNGKFPNYQIDYVMVSPQIEVGSYNIIEKKLSDHYPVKTELLLK
jgi:endonuclease/exonuclease/phosphatase family metal-dependent hydrolase